MLSGISSQASGQKSLNFSITPVGVSFGTKGVVHLRPQCLDVVSCDASRNWRIGGVTCFEVLGQRHERINDRFDGVCVIILEHACSSCKFAPSRTPMVSPDFSQ
jgi:hypothetical protein